MTAEEYRGELFNISQDMDKTRAAISGLYHAFDELLDLSEESVRSIIGLISDNIDLQHNHIERILDGKCTIRNVRPAGLRPPELWEQVHAEKATNATQ